MAVLGKELIMTIEKIGKIEAISLILVVMFNEIVLNVPTTIILSTNSGTVLNLIFIIALAIIFTLIICKLFKPFAGKDILDISEYVGGKTLKIIIGILFILLFVFLCSLSIRYLGNSIKVIYFPNSPLIFILLFLIIPILFINKFGLKTISGVNLIFMPLFLISFIFLIIATCKLFTVERIFPILGDGFFTTFVKGSTNLYAFTGLTHLYFMPALLKDSKDFKKVSVISIVISAFFLFISTLSLLMTFPAITSTDETLSVYLLTRLVEISQFLERLDALFIFVWVIALISLMSFACFYIIQIFKKISNIEDSKALLGPLGLIILGNCLAFKNLYSLKFFARVIYKYSALILIFGIAFVVLIAGNIKYKKNKPQE